MAPPIAPPRAPHAPAAAIRPAPPVATPTAASQMPVTRSPTRSPREATTTLARSATKRTTGATIARSSLTPFANQVRGSNGFSPDGSEALTGLLPAYEYGARVVVSSGSRVRNCAVAGS